MSDGCPGCGGPTEYDREVPPSPYYCSDECESKTMTDYYKPTYSQRDVDLIRGDLMQRIAELVARDEKVQELVEAVERAISAWDSHNFDGTPEAVAMERAMGRCEVITTQLKTQRARR